MRHATAALILGLALAASAFALDPQKAMTQYIHEAWQIQDGLPQNSVQALLQTSDGYLWLGTQEGLVRFDGARFVVFNKQNTEELPNHDVIALLQDHSGVLWIGTLGGGLVKFQDGKFSHYGVKQGLSNEFVRSLFEDRDGVLWIGTDLGGVNRFKDGKFKTYTTRDGLSNNFVRSIFQDSKGNMWFGTDGGGVNEFDGNHFKVYTTNEGLCHNFVSVIREDRQGALYFGTFGGGISRWKDGKFTTVDTHSGLANNFVRAIYQDRSGTFWIGTEGGLNRWSGQVWSRFGSEQGLTNDVIWCLVEDREGSLWVGTYNGGLNRLRDGNMTPFTTREGMSNDAVWSVMQDREGRLWAGTIGGGADRYQNGQFNSFTTKNGLPNDFIRALYEDRSGAIWIGTNGGGLCRLQNGQITTFTTREGLSNDFIRSIYQDSKGDFWIGTNGGGLNKWSGGVFTHYTTRDGLRSDYIRPILEDRSGRLWIATDGGGLALFKNGHFDIYDTSNGLSNNIVLALYEDAGGILWIGTLGGGLNWMKDGKLHHVGSKDGMYDDVVYQILEDDFGYLWMGCNKGIYRVSKEEILDLAAGKARLVNSFSYGISDGMKSAEVNGGSSPSGWKTRDGKLWFPTIRGLVLVDPTRFSRNSTPPNVLIETAELNGKKYDPLRDVDVPPGQGRLKFEYTALSLLVPDRVHYKVQLEGFDQNWLDAGILRSASYTNIPPGEYRFRVKACNNDGVWNEAGVSFSFRLKPHFYQTYWFYSLCLVGLIYVVSGVQRFRFNQLRAHETELSRMVEERTSDLVTAQSQLEMTNQKLIDANENLEQRVQDGINALREAERMAAYGSMVAGVAHEVRQPLFALQAAAYVLRDKLKDTPGVEKQLKTLDRESRRMAALMDDLLEFARPATIQLEEASPVDVLHDVVESFQSSHHDQPLELKIKAAPEVPKIQMDRSRMLQVFANLLINAQKHGGNTSRVVLSVDCVPRLPGEEKIKWIRFEVSDNGQGIPPEHLDHIFEPFYTTGKGTGLGLAIVHRIVTDHNGLIKADSEPGRGTNFTIFLPA